MGDPREVTVPGNPVDVVMDFQPQAVSNVGTAKVVDKTVKVLNDTISVSADSGTQWIDGVKVKFTGIAYYAGTKLPAESKDVPKDAVKVGTVEITADTPGDYPATLKLDKPVKPGFVTWVWKMDKAAQDASVKEYIKGDWSDSYGLAAETTSVREQAKITANASVSEDAKAGSWKLLDAVTAKRASICSAWALVKPPWQAGPTTTSGSVGVTSTRAPSPSERSSSPSGSAAAT
ncbi:MAG: hypothetical protein Q4B10_07725 [Actinomycetaceae bacterium]|nr:hypothetical protein [Actinomycetaceae bacterium]